MTTKVILGQGVEEDMDTKKHHKKHHHRSRSRDEKRRGSSGRKVEEVAQKP